MSESESTDRPARPARPAPEAASDGEPPKRSALFWVGTIGAVASILLVLCVGLYIVLSAK